MGSLQAREMAAALPMERALGWHLSRNHFPPVPTSMIGPCVRAIEKARRGEWNQRVRLPDGATYRGKTLAPVWAVVEQHHLDAWVYETEG